MDKNQYKKHCFLSLIDSANYINCNTIFKWGGEQIGKKVTIANYY